MWGGRRYSWRPFLKEIETILNVKSRLWFGALAMFFKSILFTDPLKYKGGGVLSPFLAEVPAGIWNHDEIRKKQTLEKNDAEI